MFSRGRLETLTRIGILETDLPDFPDWIRINSKFPQLY